MHAGHTSEDPDPPTTSTCSQLPQVTAELPAAQEPLRATPAYPTPTWRKRGKYGALTSVVKGNHVVAKGTQHLEVKNKHLGNMALTKPTKPKQFQVTLCNLPISGI